MTDTELSELVLKMRHDSPFMIERGSVVYETTCMYSDKDRLVVVPDTYKEFLAPYEKHIFEYQHKDGCGVTIDDEFVCESDFQRLIDECDVMAVEAICVTEPHVIHFERANCHFNLEPVFDKWKIRQSFSGTASNSWAKAHKKMTVEKDLDMYRGAKSLFHSLRILMFGIQVCEKGCIYNFHEARTLWYEIYGEYMDGENWDYFKEKYKPKYNELRSKLAALAPKPVKK